MIKQKTALMVLDRDGMRCRYCSNLGTDLHHCWFKSEFIVPKDEVDTHKNLISLCRRCHSEVHAYSPSGKILNIKSKTWSMKNNKWNRETLEKMKFKLLRLNK